MRSAFSCRVLAALFAITLAACGGEDDADPGNDDGGGVGSGACGALTGSCTAAADPDSDPGCQEYAGFPATQVPPIQGACEDDGGTWRTGPCSSGGTYSFGCRMVLGPGMCATGWVDYDEQSELDGASFACTQANGYPL